MVLRYVFLIALATGSAWAALNVGASQAEVYLVDAGQSGLDPKTLHLWALGALAAIIGFSLCRFVIFGLPAMIESWYHGSKHWIYTLLFGAAILGTFYAMGPQGPESSAPQGPASSALPANDPGAVMAPADEQHAPLAAEDDPIPPASESKNSEVRGSLAAPSSLDPRTDGGARGDGEG